MLRSIIAHCRPVLEVLCENLASSYFGNNTNPWNWLSIPPRFSPCHCCCRLVLQGKLEMLQSLFERLWKSCSTMCLGLNLSGMCWKRNCLCHHPFTQWKVLPAVLEQVWLEELPDNLYAWLFCPLTRIFGLFMVFFGTLSFLGEFFLTQLFLTAIRL